MVTKARNQNELEWGSPIPHRWQMWDNMWYIGKHMQQGAGRKKFDYNEAFFHSFDIHVWPLIKVGQKTPGNIIKSVAKSSSLK